jgi:hypothetical protein
MPEVWPPPEGLVLAAAIERLLDQAELDREASQLLTAAVDVRSVLAGGGPRAGLTAAGQEARAAVAVERFKPTMMEGRYRAQGRRGAPTAPFSEIPASAWPHLAVDLAGSRLQEHHTGTIWWDVRILAPIVPEPVVAAAPVPAVTTKENFRSAKECRERYFTEHPPKRNQKVANYALDDRVLPSPRLRGRRARLDRNPVLRIRPPQTVGTNRYKTPQTTYAGLKGTQVISIPRPYNFLQL